MIAAAQSHGVNPVAIVFAIGVIVVLMLGVSTGMRLGGRIVRRRRK